MQEESIQFKKMSYIVVTGGTSKIGEEIIYKLSRNSDIIFTYNKSKSKADEIKKNLKFQQIKFFHLSSILKIRTKFKSFINF